MAYFGLALDCPNRRSLASANANLLPLQKPGCANPRIRESSVRKRILSIAFFIVSVVPLHHSAWADERYTPGPLLYEDQTALYFSSQQYVSCSASVVIKKSADQYIDRARATSLAEAWVANWPDSCRGTESVDLNFHFEGYIVDGEYWLRESSEDDSDVETKPIVNMFRYAAKGGGHTAWQYLPFKSILTDWVKERFGSDQRFEASSMLQASNAFLAGRDSKAIQSETDRAAANWPPETDYHLWKVYSAGLAALRGESYANLGRDDVNRISRLLVAAVELRSKSCGSDAGGAVVTWSLDSVGSERVYMSRALADQYTRVRKSIGAYTGAYANFMRAREADVQPLLDEWGCTGAQWGALNAGFEVILDNQW